MWQMHGTMWSIIHSSQPLVFGAKSLTNAKKLVAYSFLFWGKNLPNFEKKTQIFFTTFGLGFQFAGNFLKQFSPLFG
jgi:hypothetical protein